MSDQQETTQSQATATATATLPTDLLGCVVSFCDGKTISTFLSIAIASDEHRPRLPAVIAAVLNRRLRAFVDRLSKMPSYMPQLMSPFVSEYTSTIQQDCPAFWILAVRYLSSRLAVLDYFEDAFKQNGQCGATHEWLVWSGSIHLIHSNKESGNLARFGYSESDRVESVVQVDVTSPCWYPGLTRKWSLGMQQSNVYASDYCRAYAPGQNFPTRTIKVTHVARMTPIGKVNAECIDCFNKQKRRRTFANALDRDLLNERILHCLFLVSPHDADHVSSSRMPWATGNMKACLHSVRTCPSSTLFGFWTDMASTDRMRSMTDFTADILELQQNRDRLTRICV